MSDLKQTQNRENEILAYGISSRNICEIESISIECINVDCLEEKGYRLDGITKETRTGE